MSLPLKNNLSTAYPDSLVGYSTTLQRHPFNDRLGKLSWVNWLENPKSCILSTLPTLPILPKLSILPILPILSNLSNLSNLSKNLPINYFITKLSTKKGSLITFDELKNELVKTNDETKSMYNYHLKLKEDDDLAMIYYDIVSEFSQSSNTRLEQKEISSENSNSLKKEEKEENFNKNSEVLPTKDPLIADIEKSCRSYIFEKSTLLPIATQFNKIIYNNDAIEYLNKVDWKQVVVQPCYEGTMLLVYHHNNKWYISTRRCLDSSNSKWVKNKSYKEMFYEAIEGKMKLDDLNKNYCYHFILVYYKNRNIVSYSNLGKEYKEVYHAMTTEKYTLKEVVENNLSEKILTVDTLQFNNLESVITSLLETNERNIRNTKISTEGYIFKVYEGELYKSPFTILKIQTQIYQKLIKMKPNNSNIYQSCLELYQKDKLLEFLPYFSSIANGGIQRYNKAMRTISREILDLYHCTRQKRNPEIYYNLTDEYRKVLYNIHGVYIELRDNDYKKNDNYNKIVTNTGSYNGSTTYSSMRSINVHNVYHYLKKISGKELRQILEDRMKLIENDKMIFINKNCIYTNILTRLLFGKKM